MPVDLLCQELLDASETSWDCYIYGQGREREGGRETVEVGFRGFICLEGFHQLHDLILATRNQMQQFLVNVSVVAIKGS